MERDIMGHFIESLETRSSLTMLPSFYYYPSHGEPVVPSIGVHRRMRSNCRTMFLTTGTRVRNRSEFNEDTARVYTRDLELLEAFREGARELVFRD